MLIASLVKATMPAIPRLHTNIQNVMQLQSFCIQGGMSVIIIKFNMAAIAVYYNKFDAW